jgi:hypothetical protein
MKKVSASQAMFTLGTACHPSSIPLQESVLHQGHPVRQKELLGIRKENRQRMGNE